MPDEPPVQVKYVFMDIVGYSIGRSVEDQVAIRRKLDDIVRESLLEGKVPAENTTLIPTGDGICIALVEVSHPYDIHLSLALDIVRKISLHNEATLNQARQFRVRMGINENVDDITTDINGAKNLAGPGINVAQRIMANGNDGHVLASHSVFSTLEWRDKYRGCFREYEFETKHNEKYKFFHYVGTNEPGLNRNPPSALIKSEPAPPKPKEFDPNQYGNIYWVGHDLITTAVFLLSREPREKILEGLYQSKHHLNEVGFDGSASKSRLERLYSEAVSSTPADWTNEHRAQVAREVQSLARDLGNIIAATQSGFKPHSAQ